MPTRSRTFSILLLALFLCSVSLSAESIGATSPRGKYARDGVTLTRIAGDAWVVTSDQLWNGVPTPANGLLVVTKKGIVLVDTPWNDKNTRNLVALAKRVFHRPVRLAIITHDHPDRIGGIRALLRKRIPVWSTKKTADLAVASGYPRPQAKLEPVRTNIRFGNTRIVAYFPGEGHTVDNIVVWLPTPRVLFAGCLVKEKAATSIGNTADANLAQWPATLRKLEARFPQVRVLVPGHGRWGGKGLIEHTLALLAA